MSNAGQTIRARSRAKSRSAAFSLIELLVVIAITAVLLTLLFRPLLLGFQFTSEAQAITVAQDSARVTMEQVTREIGSAAAVRDTSSQYLDMRLYTPTGGDEVLTHAYNAYLDIVPARAATTSQPTVADPTVNPYAPTGSGFYLSPSTNPATGAVSSTLVSAPVALPIAPGTTLVRYFIGLKYPFNLNYTGTGTPAAEEEPYINRDENQIPTATGGGVSGVNWHTTYAIQHNLDNPYILYRAEVSPYKLTAGSTTYTANTQLFDTNKTTGAPILDDPDFFRITSDAAHNARVYHWYQAAKPVIASSDANLIFQAHDTSGNVQYSNLSANVGTAAAPNMQTVSLPTGIAVENGTNIPILRTSVSFAPATISDQPMNATSTSDVAQGYGAQPSDALVPYIPTQYAAQSGQWAGNKNLLITDNSVGAASSSAYTTGTTPNTYTTYIANMGDSTQALKTGESAGDLIETQTVMSGGATPTSSTDVFDVSTGQVVPGGSGANATFPSNYVVFSASSGGGTANFSVPDLPLTANGGAPTEITATTTNPSGATDANLATQMGDADPNNLSNPFWYVTFGAGYNLTADGSNGSANTATVLQIHLKPQPQLPGYSQANDYSLLPNPPLSSANYLPNIATTSFGSSANSSGATSSNGRVVVNSERVYGPEENAGAIPPTQAPTAPANYPVVLYHRVPYIVGSTAGIGADQYMIDYDHGIIYLGQPKSAGGPIDTSAGVSTPQNSTVLVAFNYQNNAFIPLNPTSHDIDPTQLSNKSITADTIRATYQTNSRIEVAIGVRLYDAQSDRPTYFSLASAVTVGNANR